MSWLALSDSFEYLCYRRMLGIWAIIEHYQISLVKFARKHVYIIFFR